MGNTMSSVLVYDHGVFVSLAERLTKFFDRVGYFRPWQDCLPTGYELMTGYGLPGVDRIKYFFREFKNFDYIVFPFCADGDLQEYLRDENRIVWGSGFGSTVETHRWKTHSMFKNMQVPVTDLHACCGMDELRSYLKEHEKVWVKISEMRGLDETWFSRNYRLSEPKLAEIEMRFGPIAKICNFYVEGDIHGADEIGYGGFSIDGKFPQRGIFGTEMKDDCYVCQQTEYSDLPEEVIAVNDGMVPMLRESKYRNFIGTEIRNSMPIDITARHSSPEGETYCQLIGNLGDVIREGAAGNLVEPEIQKPFGAQVMLRTPWSKDHWTAVYFPEEIREFVKLYDHCLVHGVDYISPQNVTAPIGSVVATADTMEEAVKLARERADMVEALELKTGEKQLEEAVEEVMNND